MDAKFEGIPFNKLCLTGDELTYIKQAIDVGHIYGGGSFTEACEEWLVLHMGATHAFMTHSCTAALEMSAILSEVGPGDEVIMPSYTFVSTANAFVLRGATPVFVDVAKDTLNIVPDLIEAAITPKTKDIVPVHYAGVACDMQRILEIAEKNNLLVIEDAAQAFGTEYKGEPLGTIGHMGCISFHQTKNLVAGEAGTLLLNDDRFFDRAHVIREKGTNRHDFVNGKKDKYTWTDIGSSYLPSELVTAFLFAQLQNSHEIRRARIEKVRLYEELLAPLFSSGDLESPGVQLSTHSNGHMMYVFTDSHATRDKLLEHLLKSGVQAVFHYVPLHSSPCGLRYGITRSEMNVTDWASTCQVRLPLSAEITNEQQTMIVNAIESFYN